MSDTIYGNKTMILNTRNIVLILSVIFVVMLGIGSRMFYSGFVLFDKYLGDALYAILFYLILSLIWKNGTPAVKAVLITFAVIGIEVFQLTHIPLRLRASPNLLLKAISIILGTSFAWLDIAAYLVGIGVVYVIDRFYSTTRIPVIQ